MPAISDSGYSLTFKLTRFCCARRSDTPKQFSTSSLRASVWHADAPFSALRERAISYLCKPVSGDLLTTNQPGRFVGAMNEDIIHDTRICSLNCGERVEHIAIVKT
jgi:hypothetical protein